MEVNQVLSTVSTHITNAQPKQEDDVLKAENVTLHADCCLFCKNCEFITFSQDSLSTHNCSNQIPEKFSCPAYQICKMGSFTSKESLKVHLQIDHKVAEDELDKFLANMQLSEIHKIQIVDCHFQKHSVGSNDLQNKPKSKIFIKDVTLLRKPDLPNEINLPNIFDSLDLTHEDDIFDDFLATDEPESFDFDFEEPTVHTEQDDVIIANSEVLNNPDGSLTGKIFVRALNNMCEEATKADSSETDLKSQAYESSTSKIFVRSHESLTSQVITTDVAQQPSESSTPDCVIVSSEIVEEAPTPNKIFIRNIETLTNPQAADAINKQFFDENVANTTANFLNHSTTNYANAFTPSIYVRSYDSLISESHQQITTETTEETSQSICKISIKNMNTLIEPTLMNPPTLGIFGTAQNLVIHMRQNNTDENLINFRDTSVTPDTLPGSSNVSTCGGTDDVIILDDSEINDNSFTTFSSAADLQTSLDVCNESEKISTEEVVLENNEIENPERNQTPNDKPKIDITPHENQNTDNVEDQPMTRIPMDIATVNEEIDIEKEVPKKKMKIIKIIRVKKKATESTVINPLDAVQVVFKCNIGECSQHFSSAKLLNYHKRCHFNINQIVCPECNSQAFKSYNTLHTHLWRNHSIDMDLFGCKLCNFKTPILSRLKNFHQKIHLSEKNYKCDYASCNKRFKNAKQLKNHSQIHKAMKKKNKSIQANDNDSMKKIRCQICNKGFSSESGLYIHFMEHKNDEKRFICEEKGCEYSTNDHNSFRRHKFQHSKTHQYTCPACDYKSIQSNTYRKHLEKQHKELAESLLFKCGSCKFVTISKSKYDGHVAKHFGDV
ncbi:hypothetical protein ACKWTF_004277 [Chironomus riparius]